MEKSDEFIRVMNSSLIPMDNVLATWTEDNALEDLLENVSEYPEEFIAHLAAMLIIIRDVNVLRQVPEYETAAGDLHARCIEAWASWAVMVDSKDISCVPFANELAQMVKGKRAKTE